MKTLKRVFGNWKIWKRMLLTIGFILLFRLGTLITLPGATVKPSDYYDNYDSGSFIGILSMLGGGGLASFSIFALGVSPYITASIIIQLLSSDVIPALTRLNKQGEKGRIKMEKITRVTAIFLGILQAVAISMAFLNSGTIERTGLFRHEWADITAWTLIMIAGSMISIWIADQITMNGVGNGTSMIILTGIIAELPSKVMRTWDWMTKESNSSQQDFVGITYFFVYLGLALLLMYIIGWVESSERRIPIQQTGQGLNLNKDKQTYLPIKVNPAGVVPVIFASAMITLPPTIAQFWPETSSGRYWTEQWFSLTHWFGLTLFLLMVMGFTYFYAHININAEETADNFQKSSTFIIGVKPGEPTRVHLNRTINSMAFFGSLMLALLAGMPYFIAMSNIPESISIGGTSTIIMVSVGKETWDQIKARAIADDTKPKNKKKKKYGNLGEARTLNDESALF